MDSVAFVSSAIGFGIALRVMCQGMGSLWAMVFAICRAGSK